MRKYCFLPLLLAVSLLAGCGRQADDGEEGSQGTSAWGEPAAKEALSEEADRMILAAWDTPQEITQELTDRGLAYTVYEEGVLIVGEESGERVSIYLCPGTYEVEEGDFIQAKGMCDVWIQGAGGDKTLIRPRSSLRENKGTGIRITGGSGTVTVQGLCISGFEYGIQIKNAAGAVLEDLILEGNRYAGVRLQGASDCRMNRCILQENGQPEQGNTGYGLMIDGDCFSNTGSGNGYLNNGNRNVVDCPALWQDYTGQGNSIEMEASYTLEAGNVSLRDPMVEARTAMPDENSFRFEAEDSGYYGAEERDDSKLPSASEGKYVALYDGALTFRIQIPEAGYYRIFVVGGGDDGNNKCDKVQVNGGPVYFTSYPWQGEAVWQLSQPGLEVWTNNVLTPNPPADGFWFEEGENTVTITANWGYCAYDCIYLDKIEDGAQE